MQRQDVTDRGGRGDVDVGGECSHPTHSQEHIGDPSQSVPVLHFIGTYIFSPLKKTVH